VIYVKLIYLFMWYILGEGVVRPIKWLQKFSSRGKMLSPLCVCVHKQFRFCLVNVVYLTMSLVHFMPCCI